MAHASATVLVAVAYSVATVAFMVVIKRTTTGAPAQECCHRC